MDASRGARPELDDGGSEFTQTQPARFWGHTVLAGTSYQLALDGTELHLTQACITKPGRAIVSVQTALMDSPVPIVALRWPEGPLQQLLDLTFFPLDGSVTIRVEGGVDVNFSGSVALVGEPVPEGDEDDDEDEEEEDEEEEEGDDEPAPKAAVAAAASSVADKLKRKRDESAASAAAPAPTKAARLAPQATAAAVAKPATAAAVAAKPVAPVAVVAAKPSPAAAAPPPAPKAAKDAAAASPAAAAAAAAPEFLVLANGLVKVKDTHVGLGPLAGVGKKVTVAYEGRLGKGGKVFDRSPRFSFRLGAGDVIKGWDAGVAGMRVGGKRTLVIHPKFGYGAEGAGADIPPNATLIFDVELLATK